MQQIDIMIIGAQKAGTSSLARYLDDHPQVIGHEQLEFTYFVRDEEFTKGYEAIYPVYFHETDPKKKVLAKNVGVMYFEHALHRLKNHNPKCQIIIILRNPIDRAYSNFWYSRKQGWELKQTFEEGLAAEEARLEKEDAHAHHNTYVHRGLYAEQLERVYSVFPKEQVHVVLLEDLKKKPQEIVTGLLKVTGLEQVALEGVGKKHNTSAVPKSQLVARFMAGKNPVKSIAKALVPRRLRDKMRKKVGKMNQQQFTPPPMNPDTRARLAETFREPNERLSALLDRDLSHWNK